MENPYNEKIDLLISNEISELVIEKDEFLIFRNAWLNHSEKNNIKGEAGLGGKVKKKKNNEN